MGLIVDDKIDKINVGLEGSLELKPRDNMEFDSEQAAYDFYNLYGRSVGFGIRKESSGKNKRTGELTSRIFVCCKEGLRSKDKRDDLTKRPRAETRTSCGAQMGIKLDRRSGKYCVYNFIETHNHPLVKKEYTHMLPSQRKITASQAAEVELAEESGIPLRLAYELLSKQAGGRESLGYIKQDQNNYLRSVRQRKMPYGEVGYVLKYFSQQTLENPSFFYELQLDKEEQITNMFWADAKMIIDYGHFGDVVSFDTTYKVNEADRPFGVFVGFNHHKEIVVFGAALMYDETAAAFSWLFESFLKAMSGKAPRTIFTDQDAAMAKAISEVMPHTYHRLCIWHLKQNSIKNVHSVFKGPEGVQNALKFFFEDIEEEDEFLSSWDAMLDEYNAHDNPWLTTTFQIRRKWAYAYVRHTWSIGIQSTQISESFNARLKKYLKSDMNMVQFFTNFERVLNDTRYKEWEAEYDLQFRIVHVKIPIKMLWQARDVYTKAIYKLFEAQFEESIELSIVNCVADGENLVYTIVMDGKSKKRQVKKEGISSVSCNCRLFEMKGILCAHAIKVLREAMLIKEIPEQYILKRWSKEAKVEIVVDMHGHGIQEDPKLKQAARYRSLCSTFTRISTRASESEKTYELSIELANKLSKMIEDVLHLEIGGDMRQKDQLEPVHIDYDSEMANFSEDANVVTAKGIKKKEVSSRGRRRMKSSLEKALTKKKKSAKVTIPHHEDVGINGFNPYPLPRNSSQVSLHSPHMVGNNMVANNPYMPMLYHSFHVSIWNVFVC